MAESFTLAQPGALASAAHTNGHQRRRVLVTGTTGNIGAYFAEHAAQKYQLRLMVREIKDEVERFRQYGELVTGTLDNLDHLKSLCQGIDTVVHMAGEASPNATWDSLLQANIIGVYNMMIAAKAAGCRRLIYASSIHAVSGYPDDVQVKSTDPVNPGDLYGVTKCFGEALGRYMAEKEGLSVIALRIGAFQPIEAAQNEGSIGMLDAFISQRDMQQLLEKCIDAEHLQFAIFNGLSDNRFKKMDITDARELVGYQPQDDLTEENPRLKPLDLSEKVNAHNVTDEKYESGLRNDL